MRLLTVTPNVALDRTLTVPGWRKGSIMRTDQTLARAGGKGLNVVRAANALGLAATAVGALGGPTGRHIAAEAEQEGLDTSWTWLDQGDSRTCLIVVDPDEPSATVINEVGPTLTANDWTRLAALVRQAAGQADVTAFCGSLPPGVSGGIFGALLDDLMADGRALIVDSSGEALTEALSRPLWLVKVNRKELSAALGEPLPSPSEAADA
ncbi:MAG TPA: 1-phosphofructokinase, partial [Chloroflexi bacterium]|nr:1-phosphofructokinase [Chloroflexota bacterium]